MSKILNVEKYLNFTKYKIKGPIDKDIIRSISKNINGDDYGDIFNKCLNFIGNKKLYYTFIELAPHDLKLPIISIYTSSYTLYSKYITGYRQIEISDHNITVI